jgi:tetratricopeptide (TPR) repeat protein
MQAINTHSTAAPAPPENNNAAQNSSSLTYLTKAAAYETDGDLQMALYSLNIAAKMSPKDKQIFRKLVDLKQRMDAKADFHFKAGLERYRNQQLEKSRQEFLKTLRYNPQHLEGLIYLKTRLSPFKFVSYTAKKGEKKKDIAKKIFQNADKAFLISYFAPETGDQEFLKQEMRMELPYLEMAPVKQKAKPTQQSKDTAVTYQIEESSPPAFNVKLELAKADDLLKNKQYDNALMIADDILYHDNFSKEAEDLINRVYFQKGHDFFKQKRYLEARTYLSFIDPEFISTEEIQAKIKTILDEQAETHYLKGVNYFINEDLENAIVAWETVLTLNPEHKKAKSDIQNAKHLLEKLQNLD